MYHLQRVIPAGSVLVAWFLQDSHILHHFACVFSGAPVMLVQLQDIKFILCVCVNLQGDDLFKEPRIRWGLCCRTVHFSMKLKMWVFCPVCSLRACGDVRAVNPPRTLLEGYMVQRERNQGVSYPHSLLGVKPRVTPEKHLTSFQPELVDTLQKGDWEWANALVPWMLWVTTWMISTQGPGTVHGNYAVWLCTLVTHAQTL